MVWMARVKDFAEPPYPILSILGQIMTLYSEWRPIQMRLPVMERSRAGLVLSRQAEAADIQRCLVLNTGTFHCRHITEWSGGELTYRDV